MRIVIRIIIHKNWLLETVYNKHFLMIQKIAYQAKIFDNKLKLEAIKFRLVGKDLLLRGLSGTGIVLSALIKDAIQPSQ